MKTNIAQLGFSHLLYPDQRPVQLNIMDRQEIGVDYHFILQEGEQIRQLLPVQISELENYLRSKRTYQDFCDIRSNWVTSYRSTIWQLSIRIREKNIKLMPDQFSDQPPVSFIRWILKMGK